MKQPGKHFRTRLWTRLRVGPLLLALLVLLSPFFGELVPFAQAQDAPGLVMTARAGFDGFYKSGYWVPVQINVANDGPAVAGYLQVTVGSFSSGDDVLYRTPINLPTQSNKRVTIYLEIPRILGNPEVELRDEDGRLVAAVETNTISQLSPDSLLYGVVSPDPGELEFLETVSGSRGRAAVAFLTLTALPETAPAWNSLDVLIFNDIDTGQLTTAQQAALRQWLQTGGQLVITGGPGWQKTTATLADLLPVSITGSETVAGLPALSDRIGTSFRDPGPYLVTTSSLSSGELIFHQDGLPLLARQPAGQGQVYFLALDPKLAPLLDWDGNEVLWSTIAAGIPDFPYWAAGFRNSYAAGTAVASLPSLALPSVLTLAIFLLIYVLIIGPGNYLILKRLRRRELAWATVPALVVLFSGIAYGTGFQLKGNDVILNQMSLAVGSADESPVRVNSLIGLYSPRRSTYDVIFDEGTMVHPFERTSGDMSGSGNFDAVTQSSIWQLDNVRVDVSAVATFVADAHREGPGISATASLNFDGPKITLNARVQNNSDFMLENAALIFGNQAYNLGDLAPGAEVNHVETIVSTQGSSSTGGLPARPGSFSMAGPGSGTPLMNNAHILLGTSNYYDDRDAYPRWQMLEAIDSQNFGGSVFGAITTNRVTLAGWSSVPQIGVGLDQEAHDLLATTLYLLDIPVEQNLVSGIGISLPLSLLNWEVVDAENNYDVTVENLFLNTGSVEIEYKPWTDFADMDVSVLSLFLLAPVAPASQPAPDLRIWDWDGQNWILLSDATWGETKLTNFGRFVGPGNAVRLQLHNSDPFAIEVRQVYPVYTGNVQ